MKKVIFLLCLWMPLVAYAQDVTNLRKENGGVYTLKIDSKTFFALPEDLYNEVMKIAEGAGSAKNQLTKLKEQLQKYKANSDEYEALRKDYKSLTGGYKKQTDELTKLNTKYSNTADKLVALNKEYSQTLKDFDKLVEKYRDVALRTTPRNPVDFGLGVLSVDDTTHNVFMFGAGTDVFGLNFRGWLYGGEETYGAMLGMSF